jgi:Ca-activated chloride channel family protein
LAEARKVLVEQMSGTLVTIAKDVKIQVEFNPGRVAAYRLLGYENRVMAAQDFNDDKKDAGEIGAGHTVTALYELIPAVAQRETQALPTVDPLKYQRPPQAAALTGAAEAAELLTLKLRYKQPDGDVSKLIERPLADEVLPYGRTTADFRFAAAVASFGMVLRQSQYRGSATYEAVLELAQEGRGRDEHGYRTEFVGLVQKTRELAKHAASGR